MTSMAIEKKYYNSIPYMEIITAIESQALKLESDKKDTSAENLRQTINQI